MSATPKATRVAGPHRYVLYEAAVQDAEFDLDFFERVYRRLRGHRFTRLREDFCGSARLACTWVTRRRDHVAWAVDRDPSTGTWWRRGDWRCGAATCGACGPRMPM